jgi:hypothetical protein
MSAHAPAVASSGRRISPGRTVSGSRAAADGVPENVRRPRRLPYRSTAERLLYLSVLDPVTECWVWIAHRLAKGYGKIDIRRDGRKVCDFAHRVAWEVFNGRAIPYGYQIDHRCQNESCINPAHLECVPADVNRDRQTEARWLREVQGPPRTWELVQPALDVVALDEWSEWSDVA